ncbi:MAG: hypothetical protein KBT03_02935 [Bacteroidales bacterium]|nr:hypothetical protein [Candidatus Scybalousia scybalohippi]
MENKFQEALYIVNERFDYMNEELHPNKHYQKPQFSLDTLQQAIDDLEVYKKALRIAVANSQVRNIKGKFMEENCMKASDDYCERIGCVECIVNKSLEQARKELSNEKL